MIQPAVSASQLVLQAKQSEIDAMHQLARRAELVEAVGRLIHALQRERGASSVFLASQGQRFAGQRRETAEATAPAEARVRALFAPGEAAAAGAMAPMLSLMAWVLLGLDALPALREKVERQAIDAHEAVAAYSRLIAGPVELIFHVADAAALPAVSRLLVALLHLVQANEAAGQERAVGALLFASGTCSEAQQQRVLHLIDAQERSLQVFAEFAEPPLRARWNEAQFSPLGVRLERLRRTLCAARDGAPLDSEHSGDWFDVTSTRIDTLWTLEGELVERLRAECDAQIAQAQRALQDSEGLLLQLRTSAPPQAHAVERFFDAAMPPERVTDLAGGAARGSEPAALMALLQAQSARLASTEAELASARRALNERKTIERAKGVLMARLKLSEEAAFRALQKTSMDQNRRLLDVAEATLALPDLAFAALAEAPPAPGPAPAARRRGR
ncbi:nitrate- and nitrite sensing domain-containing protein [Aquincola sp. MAHUQ-54]|uniref:Nitrate- and nitrite sensing domain-containing protein n=1 Tax=Aquincola agrisoli TaxID=3119538 RepID=A0AAW9QGW5_9BURK